MSITTKYYTNIIACALLSLGVALPATSATNDYIQINGNPIRVDIGSDHSYQVFNNDIPGNGQFYNPNRSTADYGWIVHVDGSQYTPENGDADSGLGTRTPYSSTAVSTVTGDGTVADPYEVVVTADLGSSGLTSVKTARYINGNNYFTKSFTLNNTESTDKEVKIFLGGDIYLAGSDRGYNIYDAASGAVGGVDNPDAVTPNHVLLIPQIPADHYTANTYSSIWAQIGNGQLDDAIRSGRMDNAAALQWNKTIPAGGSVTVIASTSFGAIPSIVGFNITEVTPNSSAQGTTLDVTINGVGFAPGMEVSFGPDITVSNFIIIDGNTATATLTIGPSAALGERDVTATNDAGDLTGTIYNGFTVTADGPVGVNAVPVPTLSNIGLVLMALIMAAIGTTRRRRG